MSMGGHHSAAARKDEWLTPQHVLHALGPLDLDPFAPFPETVRTRVVSMGSCHSTRVTLAR